MRNQFKNTLFSFGLLGLTLLSSSLAHADDKIVYPSYPVIDYSKVSNPELIKQGEYLAKAGDCIACHTNSKQGGEKFAGGLGIETPFGAFFTPNITADEETGIGKWTDQEFLDAMREGHGPQGNYFPVFPYLYFNKMSQQDILAIKAYLFAIPKIHREPTPNQVPWPFNVRLAQYSWKILFFYPYRGEYKDDPTKSKEWNRGAYLVEGPGHCGMCHSPLNFLGAEVRKYRYTGGFVGGYYAPNITAVGLEKYSVEDVMDVFKKDKMLTGGKVLGPMLEVNQDSLKYLTDEDLRSIAVYLKSYQTEQPPVQKEAITPETGKKIYNKYCTGCHANGSGGAPVFGDKAAWEPRMKAGLNAVVTHAIDGINGMPPMGNCVTCSKDEIHAAVEYMVDSSLHGTSSGAPKNYIDMPQLTMEQGKAIYQKQCAACHDSGANGAPKIGDLNAWEPILMNSFDNILTVVIRGQDPDVPTMKHAINGACPTCQTSEVIAATKYLAQQGADGRQDFSLW